ncbi:MAG: D-2-hydroxyacid dehydrogenase [Acidobacteria bacterium]|nr:MAG: D-2-hydroxyacid dehydrogenase [Acidobacteriota bacterium]
MRKLFVVFFALSLVTGLSAENKKVVITTKGSWYSPFGPAEIAELKAAAPGLTLVVPAEGQLMNELADADAVLGSVTPEMIRTAKKLKWVQVGVAGVERILTPDLKNSEITLTNAKIVQGPEIADHAMAMLLALTRQLTRAISGREKQEWPTQEYRPLELQGRTAVVVGVGGIGTQIAVRAHAFGMQVIGVDVRDMPYLPFMTKCVRPDRLDAVLPEADVVFIAAPHTEMSEKMFKGPQFGLMKKNSFFIAVSRGKLYDADALVQALWSKHLAGAGLDVTDPEPLPKGHALWKLENVIITPHIAGRSDGEHRRYMELYKENLRRFANGEPLLNVVDKEKGY